MFTETFTATSILLPRRTCMFLTSISSTETSVHPVDQMEHQSRTSQLRTLELSMRVTLDTWAVIAEQVSPETERAAQAEPAAHQLRAAAVTVAKAELQQQVLL